VPETNWLQTCMACKEFLSDWRF